MMPTRKSSSSSAAARLLAAHRELARRRRADARTERIVAALTAQLARAHSTVAACGAAHATERALDRRADALRDRIIARQQRRLGELRRALMRARRASAAPKAPKAPKAPMPVAAVGKGEARAIDKALGALAARCAALDGTLAACRHVVEKRIDDAQALAKALVMFQRSETARRTKAIQGLATRADGLADLFHATDDALRRLTVDADAALSRRIDALERVADALYAITPAAVHARTAVQDLQDELAARDAEALFFARRDAQRAS